MMAAVVKVTDVADATSTSKATARHVEDELSRDRRARLLYGKVQHFRDTHRRTLR